MSGIDNIPAETRWAVATQALTGALLATGTAFEQAVGVEGYRQVTAANWREAGRNSGQLATAMGFAPPTDAPSLWAMAETLVHLTMGPEFVAEASESSPERVVAHVSECPWAKRASEQGAQSASCLVSDRAWMMGLAESFGLDIKHEITTALPLGDHHCTIACELKA